MKSRYVTPNGKEREIPANRYIVSTTDRKGRITSINDVFAEISLYSEEELLGHSHNVVRHPDMPRTIFWLVWDALLADEDCSGYIQNLCKDGSHYWVFAHFRAEHDSNGNITGFRSVRRRALSSAITRITHLYERIRSAEDSAPAGHEIAAGLSVLKAHLSEHGMSYERYITSISQ